MYCVSTALLRPHLCVYVCVCFNYVRVCAIESLCASLTAVFAFRQVTDPAKTSTLDVRSLNIELTCPVCLGILRNTVVIMVRGCTQLPCGGGLRPAPAVAA